MGPYFPHTFINWLQTWILTLDDECTHYMSIQMIPRWSDRNLSVFPPYFHQMTSNLKCGFRLWMHTLWAFKWYQDDRNLCWWFWSRLIITCTFWRIVPYWPSDILVHIPPPYFHQMTSNLKCGFRLWMYALWEFKWYHVMGIALGLQSGSRLN